MVEDKSTLKKVGSLKVKDGTYRDKDGKEKNRYHEIGILLATPHHTRMCVKLHSNGYGEGQFVNIFYDDGMQPNFTDNTPPANTPTEIPAGEVNLEEIPF